MSFFAPWAEPGTWEALARTLWIASSVALAASLLGLASAYLVARAEFPGRRFLGAWLAVPYTVPAYLLGMAWIALANPTTGLLRSFLPDCYGTLGIVAVETCVAFAFPYLELLAAFGRVDPALEEAARVSGASPGWVLARVSLPLVKRSLASGFSLAFLYALCSFGVPALLGLPKRQMVLTTLIYSDLRMGGADGLQRAASLSLLLLSLAIFFVLAFRKLTAEGAAAAESLGGAKSSRISRVPFRGAWAPASLSAFLFLACGLPWLALGLMALAPYSGQFAIRELTFANFADLFANADFAEGIRNSLALATSVAIGIAAAGFRIGYARRRANPAWARLATQACEILFSVPGSVLAIAWIMVASASGLTGLPLVSAPVFGIALVCFLKYLAVGARPLGVAFRQVHPALEEAARVAGAGRLAVVGRIWMPLLAPSVRGALRLAFLPVLTELTMSVLLTGPGGATLGTTLFRLQEYASPGSAAALAWSLLTVAILGGLATAFAEGPRERRSHV